jgi:hypothetical protein
MEALAERTGFALERVVFDSTAFQFLGSEQYCRDIPLCAETSYYTDPARSIFSAAEVDAFERRARALNLARRGDQAAFYLRKR